MPCESCEVQFTVFRRKRICFECRRYFCNNCLTKKNNASLCDRCIIFTKRPLHKNDLQQLKPKDLIFYLQSKHISTTGCVEKDELVNLILNHVNSTDSNRNMHSNGSDKTSSTKSSSGESQNPFDNIKQSCQNFFNSVSEKISSDFSFDNMKSTSPPQSNSQSNISEQPRISTREIPSYSSYNQGDHVISTPPTFGIPSSGTSTDNPSTQSPSIHGINNTSTTISTPSSDPSSPVISISSISSQSISSQTQHQHQSQNRQIPTSSLSPSTSTSQKTSRSTPQHAIPLVHNCANPKTRLNGVMNDDFNNLSGCECSDDEVIAKFKSRKSSKATTPLSETPIAGPSGENGDSFVKTQDNLKQTDGSGSGSSFEELGAVGGNVNLSTSDADKWQFVQKFENEVAVDNSTSYVNHSEGEDKKNVNLINTNNSTVAVITQPTNSDAVDLLAALRQRRVMRRRSDGYIYNQNRNVRSFNTGGEFSSVNEGSDVEELSDERRSSKRTCRNCSKCGKSKNNLKRHVAKFKKLLESSKMSEDVIKQELDEYLEFLEHREASFEYSDSELSMSASTPNGTRKAVAGNSRNTEQTDLEYEIDYDADMFFGDDDGIHVYGQNDNQPVNNRFDSRFINLGDFQSSDQLDELSVKQLKQILMLNRVDYKGCCEKQELLERVHRLWKNFQTCPAIEKLPTDELCKICMDAPIECVILECGHMATCTNCGKVLSECPICRQYIVRVVRFFRA